MLCLVSLSLRQQPRRSIRQVNSTSSIMGPKVSLSMTPCPVEETSAFCTSSASATGAFSVMGHIKWWETRVKNSANVTCCRFFKWNSFVWGEMANQKIRAEAKRKKYPTILWVERNKPHNVFEINFSSLHISSFGSVNYDPSSLDISSGLRNPNQVWLACDVRYITHTFGHIRGQSRLSCLAVPLYC